MCKHKCQFAIVMVSQIGCMICLLLVYGVFQNQVYVMGDDEADNKSISASFEDKKIYTSDVDIKKLLSEILEESNMETEMIYIEAMSSDQENMYMDYVDYQEVLPEINTKYGKKKWRRQVLKYRIILSPMNKR